MQTECQLWTSEHWAKSKLFQIGCWKLSHETWIWACSCPEAALVTVRLDWVAWKGRTWSLHFQVGKVAAAKCTVFLGPKMMTSYKTSSWTSTLHLHGRSDREARCAPLMHTAASQPFSSPEPKPRALLCSSVRTSAVVSPSNFVVFSSTFFLFFSWAFPYASLVCLRQENLKIKKILQGYLDLLKEAWPASWPDSPQQVLWNSTMASSFVVAVEIG